MEVRTLDTLRRDYLDHRRSLNYSPKTIRRMKENLSLFVKWMAQTHAIETPDRFRTVHLRAWQQHLSSRKLGNGLPITPQTINDYLSHTAGFIRFLADRGFVLKILLDALERVKTARLLPRSVLEHAQMKKLLRRIDTSNRYGFRDRAIFELLYSSGLRANEALGLNLNHVNFEQRTLWVIGKGRKERIVPVGRTALRFLKSYIVGVRPFFVVDPNEPAMFLDRDGKRYAYHNLQRIIRCRRRLKVDDFGRMESGRVTDKKKRPAGSCPPTLFEC